MIQAPIEIVEIRHFHLFCGLGGGARGFNHGRASVGPLRARFRCLGGVDVSPAAIADFEQLSGVRGTVLDPFFGSGTVGLVARRLGRQFVGIELNPKYCAMAKHRIERETGLLGPVEIVRHHSGDEARFSAAAGDME